MSAGAGPGPQRAVPVRQEAALAPQWAALIPPPARALLAAGRLALQLSHFPTSGELVSPPSTAPSQEVSEQQDGPHGCMGSSVGQLSSAAVQVVFQATTPHSECDLCTCHPANLSPPPFPTTELWAEC